MAIAYGLIMALSFWIVGVFSSVLLSSVVSSGAMASIYSAEMLSIELKSASPAGPWASTKMFISAELSF